MPKSEATRHRELRDLLERIAERLDAIAERLKVPPPRGAADELAYLLTRQQRENLAKQTRTPKT